ncbi:hypothetical protein J7643_06240 [bacterium]|nr:hypothetical protein [bacterium]
MAGLRNNPVGSQGNVEVARNPRTDNPPLGDIFEAEEPKPDALGRTGPVEGLEEQKSTERSDADTRPIGTPPR